MVATKAKPKAKKETTPARVARLRRQINRDCPGLLKLLETPGSKAYRPELKTELEELVEPRWKTPSPSTAARAGGARFDPARVERFLRFCRLLRHIKGRTYAGRPFVPDLWQIVYVIGPAFGWRRADGTRWARTVYLEVPRKNGKSTLAAAIALYLLTADGEPGAEVVSGAKDREQARAVFDVASKMAKKSWHLRKRLHIAERTGVISWDAQASTYKVISSDRAGDRKHGLNLHGAVIDELHVIPDRELIGTLETSTGSREEPLVVFITTAGIPEDSPVWLDKRDLAIKASEGVIESPELLGVIYAADPAVAGDNRWKSQAVIRGANPGYGHSLRPDYIARQIAEAEQTPANLNRFLRLHLDIPTEAVTGWIPLPIWDRTASIVDEADLRGARAWGGLDLSSALDLSALVFVVPDESGRNLDVLARFWTPKDTLVRRSHEDRANYEVWEREGFLTATPGETIDYDALEADVVELLDFLDVQAINYDPWGAKQIVDHLADAGAKMTAIRQGFQSLSPPTKETARLVTARRLRHGGNPVLRWCIANTKIVQDPAGNQKPDRKRSRSRIDGTLGLVMGIDAYVRDLELGESVYEETDLAVAE